MLLRTLSGQESQDAHQRHVHPGPPFFSRHNGKLRLFPVSCLSALGDIGNLAQAEARVPAPAHGSVACDYVKV